VDQSRFLFEDDKPPVWGPSRRACHQSVGPLEMPSPLLLSRPVLRRSFFRRRSWFKTLRRRARPVSHLREVFLADVTLMRFPALQRFFEKDAGDASASSSFAVSVTSSATIFFCSSPDRPRPPSFLEGSSVSFFFRELQEYEAETLLFWCEDATPCPSTSRARIWYGSPRAAKHRHPPWSSTFVLSGRSAFEAISLHWRVCLRRFPPIPVTKTFLKQCASALDVGAAQTFASTPRMGVMCCSRDYSLGPM